ncbi:MAG: thiopurine S-methyltransferase [Sideroxyarcus sp.]|nr:thiopurine S-methyltransferase [Sideroxyarcus sp.]
MHHDFWHERWHKGEIGFHQNEVNSCLLKYWDALAVPDTGTVFVPLCGKSADMILLRRRGHPVLGVELSMIAAQSFFAENGATPHATTLGDFECLENDGINLLCGDFFALRAEDLALVSAVYDRAALVALPPEMRREYAAHMARILPPETQMLLIVMEYPQPERKGPPFAVALDEVRALYGAAAAIEVLESRDVLDANPRFKQQGLTRMWEHVLRLRFEKDRPSEICHWR